MSGILQYAEKVISTTLLFQYIKIQFEILISNPQTTHNKYGKGPQSLGNIEYPSELIILEDFNIHSVKYG